MSEPVVAITTDAVSAVDSDAVSVLSFGDAGSMASSLRSNKRAQGQWHDGRTPKSARTAYRRDLAHALKKEDQRSREFHDEFFRELEELNLKTSVTEDNAATDFIRILLNDATSTRIESFLQERNKQLSQHAIIDDRMNYATFVSVLINKPLVESSGRWIRYLFDKGMHAFLNNLQNVPLVATATLAFAISYIVGAESPTSDALFNAWKENILPVCTTLAAHRDAKRGCPYVQLQTTESPVVEFIFNSVVGSWTCLDPDSKIIKYSLLLTAVVHAASMLECHHLLERSNFGLLAMTSNLHKFKIVHLQKVQQLCNHTAGVRSMQVLKLVEDVEYKMASIYTTNDKQVDGDPLVRATLRLVFKLAQEPDAHRYADDARAILASIKMLRSSPLVENKEYYKTQPIAHEMLTPYVLNEWVHVIQNAWTVFLRDVCVECDGDQDKNNFFSEFGNWIEMSHREAQLRAEKYALNFARFLLSGQRTSLKLFHNVLITSTRARFHPHSMFGLAMPMFDFLKRPGANQA